MPVNTVVLIKIEEDGPLKITPNHFVCYRQFGWTSNELRPIGFPESVWITMRKRGELDYSCNTTTCPYF